MAKDNLVYIKHISESINLIQKYTKGLDFNEFKKSWTTIDAVIRRIEVMGEAARNVSKEFSDKHKDVPWRDIIDMRNYLIHEYFNVDEEEVWRTIKNDLPKLKKIIAKI